jgi:outer membrane protein with beta-barrel domain
MPSLSKSLSVPEGGTAEAALAALCVGGAMRSRFMWRGALIASLGAAIVAGPAWAQNREKAWEVSPELGWIFYGNPHLGDGTSDRLAVAGANTTRTVEVVTSDIQDSMAYGFRFGYHFTRKQMIEFGFSGTSTTGTYFVHKTVYSDPTPVPPPVPPAPPFTPTTLLSDARKQQDVSVDLIVAHVNYIYNFFMQHRGKVVAFATGGGGLVNSSIFGQTADPDLEPTLGLLVGDENTFMYNYGAGIRFFGSEKAGLRIDARQVRYSSKSRSNQDHIEVGIALTIILGGA